MTPYPPTGPAASASVTGRLSSYRKAAVVVLCATLLGAVWLFDGPDPEAVLGSVHETLGEWTYMVLAALVFLETAAFVGLAAPGEVALLIGGALAAQGSIDLAVAIPLAWVSAATGDLVGFELGRRLGRGFLARRGPRIGVSPARRDRVDAFLVRHGTSAIFIGRLVGFVRSVMPFLAGASEMKRRTFILASLTSAGAWAATLILLGFAFHRSFGAIAEIAPYLAFACAALLIGVFAWRRTR